MHRAHDVRTGEAVAIQLLRERSADALGELKSEFRLVREIQHPNLVRLNALKMQDGMGTLTMELVDGEPLVASLRAGGAPSLESVFAAFRQLAGALQTLHAHD